MVRAGHIVMPVLDPLYDASSEQRRAFEEWDRPSRTLQIRSITFLTGLLYIVFSFIDGMLLPAYALPFGTLMHLYVLPPLLFVISAMTYVKKLYRVTVVILALSPVIANLGNLYLYGILYPVSPYLAEIYTPEVSLSIIWMFAISGLRLPFALASASVTIAAHLAYELYLGIPFEVLCIHSLWIVAAVSFGILSALILDKKSKQIFLDSRELEYLATTDKLSGLYNRMKIEAYCLEEIERVRRYGGTFSIILLDIDHFKEINDTCGHNVGDHVIQKLAQIMSESVRSVDRTGRWGGEEFLILLPETGGEQAFGVAEHLRRHIEESDFSPACRVLISAGVAEYAPGDTIEKIVQRADEALYAAKEGGRNQTRLG